MSKTALVTGSTKGIGHAISKKLLENGFHVVMCARTPPQTDDPVMQHPHCSFFQCDLGTKTGVQALADYVLNNHPALDLLVNNAGTFLGGQVHSEDDSVFETMISTNLSSAYYLTKRLLPPMIAQKSGTVVNMCSIASINPYAQGGAYCISKFALLGFSKVLREEMKPLGIRVISVLPGATYTDSWKASDLPQERFMPAEDIAAAVWSAYSMSPQTVVEEIILRPMAGDIV